MNKEIKFDLDKDIIMQIEMDSYMKYNDTIVSMNDHLGEIYGYSDVKDMKEMQLKYEKKLAYKAIKDLQQKVEQLESIRKEAVKLCDEMLSILYHYDDRKVWEDMKDILNKESDKK